MSDLQSQVGRPEGTVKRSDEALEHLYCAIEIALGLEAKRTGRKPSISKMCRLIVQQGGYHEIIACEDANLFSRPDDIRLGRLTDDGSRIQLGREGHLLLTNSIQCAASLRRRYSEAKKKLIESERYVLMKHRISDALGEPRPDAGWYAGWRPPIGLFSLH